MTRNCGRCSVPNISNQPVFAHQKVSHKLMNLRVQRKVLLTTSPRRRDIQERARNFYLHPR